MKKLIIAVLFILAAVPVLAQTFTFTRFDGVSTARASITAPNLRIAYMYGPMQVTPGSTGPGSAMQTAVVSQIVDYYLTKSITVDMTGASTLPPKAVSYFIPQVDQDTKLYVDSDLTNYLLLQSGIPFGAAPRN